MKNSSVTSGPVRLLVSTRKGGFTLRSDAARRAWQLSGPIMLGNIVNHMVRDPRDKKTLLMAASAGHLGPTVYRSTDNGKSWKEATQPPRFHKLAEGGKAVDQVFSLHPGHPSQPGVWYAGTSPQGLFRSDDGGDTWDGVAGFNDNPKNAEWCGRPQDGPPGGHTLHSLLIDPRDPQHMYLGMSIGGVFESTDQGKSWAPLNKGQAADFLPNPDADYGHDPHCVQMHPLDPDILYQQNHCGIYRMHRPEARWDRVGNNMPKAVGDIGFPITLHPRDTKTAWVFPMDGTAVWPRVSPGGKPATYVTRNSGKTWKRQSKGLPERQGWFTVFRQAMSADAHDPLGLYFGTTGGEVWASCNEGESWTCIARHLPRIQAVVVG